MIENGNAKQTNDQNAKYAEEANQGDVKGFVGTRHPNIDAFCSRPPNPNPPLPHNILINNDTVATHFKKEHLNTSLKLLLCSLRQHGHGQWANQIILYGAAC